MTSNELEIFKQSILDDVRVMMQSTGQVTQYIGARYVPLFADPLDWNSQMEYEPLTIVLNQGNSFTSRQFVPKGIDISNTDFWANTGNYNAQIEQYRNEVYAFNERITKTEESTTTLIDKVSQLESRNNMFSHSNILWVGDSIAAGQGAGGKEKSFAAKVTKNLNANYYNNAYGGAGFLNGTTLKQQILEFKANNPNLNIDYIMFMVPLNDGTYINEDFNNYFRAISDFYNTVKTTYPNALLYYFNCPYNTNPFQASLASEAPTNKEYNSYAITRYYFNQAHTLGVISGIYNYTPLGIFSIISELPNAFMQSDGIHYTESGHAVLAQNILKQLGGSATSSIVIPSVGSSLTGYSCYDENDTIISQDLVDFTFFRYKLVTVTPTNFIFNCSIAVESSTKKIKKVRIWNPLFMDNLLISEHVQISAPGYKTSSGTMQNEAKNFTISMKTNKFKQLVDCSNINGDNAPIFLEIENRFFNETPSDFSGFSLHFVI